MLHFHAAWQIEVYIAIADDAYEAHVTQTAQHGTAGQGDRYVGKGDSPRLAINHAFDQIGK